jgi:hypothetical protein
MKQLINWIAGFFDSTSERSSSKRLVGIVGAFTLFITLYSNSHSEAHIAPSEALVWADVVVICTSLGLASVNEIGEMVSKFKGNTPPPSNPEPTKE